MKQIEELLQAIKTLESQRATLGESVVDTALEPLEEKLTQLEQGLEPAKQRRLVSVLFLDIYNSTLLSQGLEPEEVLEIIGGTLKDLSEPVREHGGEVTQVMGDGFMAVFGLAKTHEDDAREATQAGLAMLARSKICAERLHQKHKIQGFNVRVGINTGRVVTGKFTMVESTVMGLTVSLAARMEQTAQPGTLNVSQFTYQHIRGAFDVEELPTVEAKGFPQPIPVYRVLSAQPKTFKTLTRGVEGAETMLVGRVAELEKLKTTMRRAFKERKSQLITITGEAGLGKSRLLYEFDRWVAQSNESYAVFKARASHQMTSMPYGLLRELISYRLNLLPTDSNYQTRTKLVDEFSEYLQETDGMKAHFIGSLLGFNFSDSKFLQGVSNDPKQLGERAQRYLMEYLQAVVRKTNTIIMLDDIHWSDQESLNFITRFCQEYPHLPLAIICLTRPIYDERFPEWMKESAHTEEGVVRDKNFANLCNISLRPLSRQESLELMRHIFHHYDILPVDVREKIIIATNGNPFYIEEYIQALIDRRAILKDKSTETWKVDLEKLAVIELPTTLISLLESRLDSLQKKQKALLQQAAVIGQVFWLAVLQALRMGNPVDEHDLATLSERRFIYRQETTEFEGTQEYRFQHALLREVAYQAMFKKDKKISHRLVADWLVKETQIRGRDTEFASIIAEHYEFAGNFILAADWYTTAGTVARQQGAPTQSVKFFDHALSLIQMDETATQSIEELVRYWHALARRDEVLGILGQTERRKNDDVALVKLAKRIGDDDLIAEAYYRQGFALAESGQYQKAYESYQQGLEAAIKAQNIRLQALILGVKVTCELRLGNLPAASGTSKEAIACAEELGDEQIIARTLNNVSTFYTESGDLGQAIELLERQLEINRKTGNIEGEVVGLSNLGYTYILIGLPGEGIPSLMSCIEKAKSIGHRSFAAYGGLNLALALLRNGDPLSALKVLDLHITELELMNDTFGFATGQAYMALSLEISGDVSGALEKYELSARIFTEIGIEGSLMDAKAGVTRCLLNRNQLEEAEINARLLMEFFVEKNGSGMEFPFLGYETCFTAYTQCGKPDLARKILDIGHRELLRRAEKISTQQWRKSFLELIPENHSIQERWQRIISHEEMESAG